MEDTQLTMSYAMPRIDADEHAAGKTGGVVVKLTLVDRHSKGVVFSRLLSGHAGEAAMSTAVLADGSAATAVHTVVV